MFEKLKNKLEMLRSYYKINKSYQRSIYKKNYCNKLLIISDSFFFETSNKLENKYNSNINFSFSIVLSLTNENNITKNYLISREPFDVSKVKEYNNSLYVEFNGKHYNIVDIDNIIEDLEFYDDGRGLVKKD